MSEEEPKDELAKEIRALRTAIEYATSVFKQFEDEWKKATLQQRRSERKKG